MSSSLPRALAYGRQALDLPAGPFRLDATASPAPPVRPLDGKAIRAAFDRPLASPSMKEIFHGSRRVLIVVSDATRATGSDMFLPALVDRVRSSCGAEVAFIVASGIHRRPTDDEINAILGPEVAHLFPVIRHDPDQESRLEEVGRTRAGTPVRVNAALREHDRIVLTGVAAFHYSAGFSGGRKSLMPGLASRETITRSHMRTMRKDGARHPGARAGRLRGNPMHRELAEGAAMVGPHLLVNSVLGEEGGIERLFVGHWRRAHEAACRYLRSRRTVRLEPRDLVVASAGGDPSDIDLIQSHKAFEAGVGALRTGGVFILAASCRQGAGHEDFLAWFRHGGEREMARALRANPKVYGQTALSWFRKARACRLILVSDLDTSLVRQLGAEHAEDLAMAFRLALRYIPGGTRGWLLPQGSGVLVEPTAQVAS